MVQAKIEPHCTNIHSLRSYNLLLLRSFALLSSLPKKCVHYAPAYHCILQLLLEIQHFLIPVHLPALLWLLPSRMLPSIPASHPHLTEQLLNYAPLIPIPALFLPLAFPAPANPHVLPLPPLATPLQLLLVGIGGPTQSGGYTLIGSFALRRGSPCHQCMPVHVGPCVQRHHLALPVKFEDI